MLRRPPHPVPERHSVDERLAALRADTMRVVRVHQRALSRFPVDAEEINAPRHGMVEFRSTGFIIWILAVSVTFLGGLAYSLVYLFPG